MKARFWGATPGAASSVQPPTAKEQENMDPASGEEGGDPIIRGFGARRQGLGGERQRQGDLQMPPSSPAVSTRPRQARPRAEH